MKIFIDIGHPAHVHYFRNFIKIMQIKKHEFFITARNKDITYALLDHYKIDYSSRGEGKKCLIGKFIYIFKADSLLFRYAKKLKPDLFISFASPYAAHVAWLMRKPHIVFDDTEHATLTHKLYRTFSTLIITPEAFSKQMGRKHNRFNSVIELCYLHPKYFKPDINLPQTLLEGKDKNKIALIRLVSWDANHDIGQSGLTRKDLDEIITMLCPKYNIYISSEKVIPEKYMKYQLKIPPYRMHDLIACSDIFITEGGTMASEAAVLGTPVIYVNTLSMGYIDLLKQYNLIISPSKRESPAVCIEKILSDLNVKKEWQKRRQKFLKNVIDPTEFMVKLVSSYDPSTNQG